MNLRLRSRGLEQRRGEGEHRGMGLDFRYPPTAGEVTGEMLAMEAAELKRLSKYPLEVAPSKEALYQRIARGMADEIRGNNERGEMTRWILPMGPKGQYPILAEICNREGI